MVFCTEFLDGWWSWEPLRRSYVRCGWCRAPSAQLRVQWIHCHKIYNKDFTIQDPIKCPINNRNRCINGIEIWSKNITALLCILETCTLSRISVVLWGGRLACRKNFTQKLVKSSITIVRIFSMSSPFRGEWIRWRHIGLPAAVRGSVWLESLD